MSRARPPVLVVTGPTGSGKSTLCRWLAELGAWWIDADAVGHEMLRTRAVREAVRESFGEGVFAADGEISRADLGQVVFAAAGALAQLNRIVHPPLVAELRRRIDLLQSGRGVELVVVDAALHFQFEPRLAADLVVGLRAPALERVRRLVQRDGLAEAQAEQRLRRQAEVETSLTLADAVLDSGVSPEELRWQFFELVDLRLGTEYLAKLARMQPGPASSNSPHAAGDGS